MSIEDVFADLRLAQRRRIAGAIVHLERHGKLNRADIMRIGEVSTPQAAIDLRIIQDRLPFLMRYDKSAKTYRLDQDGCPGHVACDTDPKRCGWCWTHIDELRPPETE